nr:synaptogenesis protein syg-2-like [Procambarus clarkii]
MVAGQRITEGVLGPLQEGSSLTITCSVVGGIPPPSLVWKKHNKVLESTVESRTGGLTVNQLSLPHLSRAFHSARLTCVATNNNVTSPVHATLTITMNLRPLLTRLEDPPKSLRVGKEYHISCLVAGSRPHPNITWTLGNVASHSPILAETEHGVNTSTSLVTVTASRRHHGQRLTCTSINPLFPAYPLSDSILLNVTCE